VIPVLVGVPIAGTLLVIAIDLTNERINIHNEPIVAWSGACRPRPPEAVSEYSVELADVPEGERPQERPERRRSRHSMAQHRPCLARAKHVTIIDAVHAERHR